MLVVSSRRLQVQSYLGVACVHLNRIDTGSGVQGLGINARGLNACRMSGGRCCK